MSSRINAEINLRTQDWDIDFNLFHSRFMSTFDPSPLAESEEELKALFSEGNEVLMRLLQKMKLEKARDHTATSPHFVAVYDAEESRVVVLAKLAGTMANTEIGEPVIRPIREKIDEVLKQVQGSDSDWSEVSDLLDQLAAMVMSMHFDPRYRSLPHLFMPLDSTNWTAILNMDRFTPENSTLILIPRSGMIMAQPQFLGSSFDEYAAGTIPSPLGTEWENRAD